MKRWYLAVVQCVGSELGIVGLGFYFSKEILLFLYMLIHVGIL